MRGTRFQTRFQEGYVLNPHHDARWDWGPGLPTFEISTDDPREKWEELYQTLRTCADAYRRASREASRRAATGLGTEEPESGPWAPWPGSP